MKRCPACSQTYTDDELSFCINDGTALVRMGTSDPQATIMSAPPPPPQSYNDAGQSGWTDPPGYSPPQAWNAPGAWQPPPAPQSMQGVPPPTGMAQVGRQQPQMSLGIASLICGVLSITLGLITCTGPVLALVALILGIVALVQIKNDPQRFGGKGFAIGGIALAALWGVFIFFWLLLMVLGSLGR